MASHRLLLLTLVAVSLTGCADYFARLPIPDQISIHIPPTPTPVPASPAPMDPVQIEAELQVLRQKAIHLNDRIAQLQGRIDQELGRPTTPAIMPTLDPVTPDPTIVPSPTLTPTPDPTPLQVSSQTVSLPGDVLFDFNQSTLRPEATVLLQRVVDMLNKMPAARIQVAGHTDNIGSEIYNLALSLERANAVRDHILPLLAEPERFTWTTTGLGFAQPLADNSTDQGRQRNRRVDVLIAP